MATENRLIQKEAGSARLSREAYETYWSLTEERRSDGGLALP
jgi:hypothetical protein